MAIPYTLTLDIGTGVIKAHLFSPDGSCLGSASYNWSYESIPNIPLGLKFHPKKLLELILKVVKKTLASSGSTPELIGSVICTSQRLGFIFMDRRNQAIYGIPNIDRRAVHESKSLPPALGEKIYNTAGRWPGPLHLINRIRWFKTESKEIWDRVAKILSISDWLGYELSGIMSSDPTTACETCLFDIQKLEWSDDILYQEALQKSLFPSIEQTGSVLGTASTEFSKSLGLMPDTKVIVGGGDTEFGAIGIGACYQGDIAVIAGSSAPVEAVSDTPTFDMKYRTIINPYPIHGQWLLESNAMLTGESWKWVKELFFPDSGEKGYELLERYAFEAYKNVDTSEYGNKVLSFLGASIMNSREGNLPNTGGLFFYLPSLVEGRIGRSEIALSAIESVVFAIVANISQLCEVSKRQPERVLIGGGQSRISLLISMIANLVNQPVFISNNLDITSLGAALVAFKALGVYGSFDQAMKKMIKYDLSKLNSFRHEKLNKGNLKKKYQHWINTFNIIKDSDVF